MDRRSGTAAPSPPPAAPAPTIEWRAATLAVARRPELWATALRQVARLAPRGWWRHPPYLPAPDRAWARFRLQTMYGDAAHEAGPDDLVAWLRWCRAHHAAGRAAARGSKARAAGPPGVG